MSVRRSALALFWRQIRVSTAVMALLLLMVIEVGVTSYGASGGARGMAGVIALLKNPAISALYGRARTLDTAGAFLAWKMGMFLALAVAAWAALASTRLTRAGEDDGSWDYFVASRPGRAPTFAAAATVLAGAGAAIGALTFASLAIASQNFADAALYGGAIAGVAWTGSAIGLLCSQVLSPRRSASQGALGIVGITFLLRMLADSSSGAGWLRWLTPFGWLENVGAFQNRSPSWIVVLLAVPVAVALVAMALNRGRDVGSALWTRSDRRRAKEWLLVTSWRFAWRERTSTLWTWTGGIALLGLTIGYLTNALVAFGRSDPAYVALLDRWGFGAMITAKGFVGEICTMVAVALGFLVVTLLAAVGGDAQSGRLDAPLAMGVSRAKWLGGAMATTIGGTLAVAMACGLFTWIGVEASGTSMSLWDPLRGMLNATSVDPLLIGLTTVLVVATARFAFLTMASVLAIGYLAAVLGPVLKWPHWLVGASPFHYVTLVPSQAPNWGATLVFVGAGTLLAVVALLGFERIDLRA
jgi:ABC-2 type transport system permease protein